MKPAICNPPSATVHVPVLLQEVLDGLGLQTGMTVVDCTVNAAGHAVAIAERIGSTGTIIGIDADVHAIRRARERVGPLSCNVHLVESNFRLLANVLEAYGVAEVSAVLLDLGLSSDQLESSGRGFSFQKDEPLSMAFAEPEAELGTESDSKLPLTAREIVNDWSEESLADIIWGYGGERYARRIAKAIVVARAQSQIERALDLASLVTEAIPGAKGRWRLHPATKTFQALRIAVNDELGALRAVLPQAWAALAPGGRLAVISFHELEDRIVKDFHKEKKLAGEGESLAKKPIVPTSAEVTANPRSRSAKLRILIKDTDGKPEEGRGKMQNLRSEKEEEKKGGGKVNT